MECSCGFAVSPLYYSRVPQVAVVATAVVWSTSGMGSNVYASVKIWAPWRLRMGHRTCLGPEVICYNQDWVVLEDDAIVSQYSYLCTAGHDTSHANTADEGLITAPIVLRNGAWIGSRAFVGMGVEIGKGAVVGATASVYKNVEPWTVVGGNPAKVLKKIESKNE